MSSNAFFNKVDTQCHTISRGFDELKMLSYCGVKDIISTLYIPVSINHATTFKDLFEWICYKEPKRGKLAGVNIHPVVGIHPGMIPKDSKILNESLRFVEEYVRKKVPIALGETGLDKGTQEELIAFKRHLELARTYKLPVIIHTPQKNKAEMTRLIMKEVKKSKIDKCVIDHCDKTNIKYVLEDVRNDIKIGVSINPKNLSIKEAVELYKNYSYPNRFVLNSNSGSGPGNYLSMVKTIEFFLQSGVSSSIVQKMAYGNSLDIFRGISNRF